jgi:hypothetical protein
LEKRVGKITPITTTTHENIVQNVPKRRPKLGLTVLAASVVCITLQAHYFSSVSLSPFPILGAFILFGYATAISKFQVSRTILFAMLFFSLLTGIFSIMAVKNGFGSAFGQFVAYLFNYLTVFSILLLRKNNSSILLSAFTITLKIHIAFWLIQAVYWLMTGSFLDFVEPITGDASRYSSSKGISIHGTRIPRFTGLYLEPGTYSNYLYGILVVRLLLSGKADLLGLIGCVSMFLSFSLFGAIFASSYCLIYVIEAEKKILKFLIAMGVLLLSLRAILPVYNTILGRVLSGVDLERAPLIKSMLENVDPFWGLNRHLVTIAVMDNTLYLASYIIGGLILLIPLITIHILVCAKKKGSVKMAISLIFATKIKFSYPFLGMVLAIAIDR